MPTERGLLLEEFQVPPFDYPIKTRTDQPLCYPAKRPAR